MHSSTPVRDCPIGRVGPPVASTRDRDPVAMVDHSITAPHHSDHARLAHSGPPVVAILDCPIVPPGTIHGHDGPFSLGAQWQPCLTNPFCPPPWQSCWPVPLLPSLPMALTPHGACWWLYWTGPSCQNQGWGGCCVPLPCGDATLPARPIRSCRSPARWRARSPSPSTTGAARGGPAAEATATPLCPTAAWVRPGHQGPPGRGRGVGAGRTGSPDA